MTWAERIINPPSLSDDKAYARRARSGRFRRSHRTAVRSHCCDAVMSDPLATEEEIPEREPQVRKPQVTEDGTPVLLSSSFYVVSGSIGTEARALKPFRMALDTGASYNLVNKRILQRGYEEYMTRDSDVPALCDANGKRLATHGTVVLKVRLGNSLFTTRFMVAEKLAVDVLIGTEFLKPQC